MTWELMNDYNQIFRVAENKEVVGAAGLTEKGQREWKGAGGKGSNH